MTAFGAGPFAASRALRYVVALIAALAAMLGFATATATATATAAAAVGAETRVGVFNVIGEVLVGPPQHIPAGQRLGNNAAEPVFVVATGVAANSGKALEKWAWPPNRGFLNDPVPTTLKPGTVIDRYGREGGTFVSPKGTPFRQRSLPPESANAPYRQYEVVGDLEVRGGIAAPWFGQPGGGVQYELPSSVADLISRGILKPVG